MKRLRRTLLWVNGNDQKKLKEAIDHSNADVIVLELEDMCPESHKIEARKMAVEALSTWDFKGKERGVRINGLDTKWGREDLEAILPCVPDVIRLPKCETRDYVIGMDAILTQFELTHNIPKNRIELILMIETPFGLTNLYEMATCCERVTGIGFGAGDFTCAMGIDRDLTVGATQLLYVKQKLAVTAKAADCQVFDTTVVCRPDQLSSMNEFIRKDCEDIKQMGFSGRSVSMMEQIDIINEVFAPSKEEVERSYKIIDGYEEGLKKGVNEIWVDNMFLDPPVIEKAKKIIEFAKKIKEKHGA